MPPPLTENEAFNGWTAETLDAFVGDALGYQAEVLSRWREQQRRSDAAVVKFKAKHDGIDPAEKRQLTELELSAAHCRAMSERAADRLDNI